VSRRTVGRYVSGHGCGRRRWNRHTGCVFVCHACRCLGSGRQWADWNSQRPTIIEMRSQLTLWHREGRVGKEFWSSNRAGLRATESGVDRWVSIKGAASSLRESKPEAGLALEGKGDAGTIVTGDGGTTLTDVGAFGAMGLSAMER
jgi:hypothetical protein